MVFSSLVFLFYFLPVFLLVYYLADKRYKNVVILCGSIFFYAWGAPRFIFILLGVTTVDFYLVRLMDKQQRRIRKVILLCCSLGINLGLLFYFKYSNFFIANLDSLLLQIGAQPILWAKIALPIGISFYTFETITYVIDVYRGEHKPLRNFWDYQMYIILFPKLIAGPIIRFNDFAGQVYDHTNFETIDNKLRGLYRFSIGLAKKVFIANVMGEQATSIFGTPVADLGTLAAWGGALSYTFQIYFDFSGYTDMAIGLGLMMGFRFPENFNNPYTAVSITDFWRRWHMTLGAWMRNYLYIPLGGNRVKHKWRLYLNLWLVFLMSGLWHGAAWGFIIWGAYHGLFLVLERIFLAKWLARLGKWAVLYTFPLVVVGWVFFRQEHFTPSIRYIRSMFSWSTGVSTWRPDVEFIVIFIMATLFSFFTIPEWARRIQHKVYYGEYSLQMHYVMVFTCILLCILSAGRISTVGFNPFIYFRF